MQKSRETDGRRWTLTLALAPLVAGGCGLGTLLSAPWITDADDDSVVFIGDSIFALSGEIQDALHATAGGTFRNYTTSGAELSGGAVQPSIAAQFDRALLDDSSFDTVVMDGGGNDILIPAVALGDPYDCKTQWYEFGRLSRSCRDFIDDLYVEVVDFINDMGAVGVSDVVYLGYYHTGPGLLLADDLDEAVDYGDAILASACANAAPDCGFVDPRPVMSNADIIIDGVHPATSGSQAIAGLIWTELSPRL